MSSLKDHCVRLQDIGLLESTFESRKGSWLDYFEPIERGTDTKQVVDASGARISPRSGQFGDVILVKDRKTDTQYALKIFKKPLQTDEKQRLALLLKFSNMVQKDAWPKSLVRYISVFNFSDVPYETLLMQSIDGVPLKMLIDQRYERVPLQQWKCWMKDILDALQFLHEHGIMHRDVHPGNIMISADGKRAFLIDLDLMCVPSTSEQCQDLCHGVAAAKSTAPDIWCIEDALSASSPQQWYRSDVWATANSFLSYAYGEDGALTQRLGYTKRGPTSCNRTSDAKVIKEANYVTQFVDKPLRPLFLEMLHPDWTKRPTAKEAIEVLGDCLQRDNFVAPRSPAVLYQSAQSGSDRYSSQTSSDAVYSEFTGYSDDEAEAEESVDVEAYYSD